MLERFQFMGALKEWANANNFKLTDMHVSHGGSLLMMGMRDVTDDIDLTVSRGIWKKLLQDGHKVKTLPATEKYAAVDIISVTSCIDVHLDSGKREYPLEVLDGIQYRGLDETIYDKELLNREKDQPDLEKLYKLRDDRKTYKYVNIPIIGFNYSTDGNSVLIHPKAQTIGIHNLWDYIDSSYEKLTPDYMKHWKHNSADYKVVHVGWLYRTPLRLSWITLDHNGVLRTYVSNKVEERGLFNINNLRIGNTIHVA